MSVISPEVNTPYTELRRGGREFSFHTPAFDLERATESLQTERPPHRRDLILRDMLCVLLAFGVAAFVSYGDYLVGVAWWKLALLFAVPTLLWAPTAMYNGAYAWYEKRFLHDEIAKVIYIVVMHFGLSTILYYNSNLVGTRRSFLFLAYGLLTGMLLFVRFYYRDRVNKFVRPFNYIVVGGKADNLAMLRSGFEYAFQGKAKLLGRFGATFHEDFPNLGGYGDLKAYLLSTHDVNKVIFIDSPLAPSEEEDLINICESRFIDLEVLPRETNLLPRGFKMQHHGNTPLLTQLEDPLSRLMFKIIKRGFDIAVSLFVVVFMMPFIVPLVAVAIKLDSKGPIFFRQERSGYLNNAFGMLKFRTMTVNDESDVAQASRGDARITRVGAFLRKTSLDEFPQFWNVLVGDMSVVGPRPHMLKHTEEYARLIRSYLVRHKVKPGVTGWAQVNGLRGPTETIDKMERRVQADVWYLKNWSIWLDIRCVLQTVYNAVRGEENAV